jgi:RimJ/RimL family protein N-acetyltransferase
MQIQHKNLVLAKLQPNDYEILFGWRNSASFLNYCTNRKPIENLEKFIKEIETDFSKDRHIQFLILFKEKAIGTIYSYGYNSFDRYCFITTYVCEEYKHLGLGIKAFIMFSELLFTKYNLFKIYSDVYEYNINSMSLFIKSKMKIEGTFIRQHLFEGDRYDVIRFAFYQDDITSTTSKYLKNERQFIEQ